MKREDLEKLSDFEINSKIFHVLDGYRKGEFLNGVFFPSLRICGDYEVPDYCNNPNDMMPLVFENKISLVEDDRGGYYAHPPISHFAAGGESGCFDYECDYAIQHINPLRAAAIVYLLIQGDSNEAS